MYTLTILYISHVTQDNASLLNVIQRSSKVRHPCQSLSTRPGQVYFTEVSHAHPCKGWHFPTYAPAQPAQPPLPHRSRGSSYFPRPCLGLGELSTSSPEPSSTPIRTQPPLLGLLPHLPRWVPHSTQGCLNPSFFGNSEHPGSQWGPDRNPNSTLST